MFKLSKNRAYYTSHKSDNFEYYAKLIATDLTTVGEINEHTHLYIADAVQDNPTLFRDIAFYFYFDQPNLGQQNPIVDVVASSLDDIVKQFKALYYTANDNDVPIDKILFLTALMGSKDAVETIISNDENIPQRSIEIARHYAARNGQYDTVVVLSKWAEDDDFAIRGAIWGDQPVVMNYLMNKEIEDEIEDETEDEKEDGIEDEIGAEIEAKIKRNRIARALQNAIIGTRTYGPSMKCIEALINMGADLNKGLDFAAYDEQPILVRYFIEKGATDLQTALKSALDVYSEEAMEVLITYPGVLQSIISEFLEQKDWYSLKQLANYVDDPTKNLITYLLETKPSNLNQALMMALNRGKKEIIQLLATFPGVLISSTELFLKDKEWITLIKLAQLTGAFSDSLEDLMVWGAAIGSLNLVRYLIEGNYVDPLYDNNSAIATAQHYEHTEIVEYLDKFNSS